VFLIIILIIASCTSHSQVSFVFAAAFFVGCALGEGEITLTGMPKGMTTVNCGASFTVNFNYTAAKVPDGSSLNITLVIEDFLKNEIVVAQLGKVVAPAKSFGVAIPQPFPADWVGGEKLKGQQGHRNQGHHRNHQERRCQRHVVQDECGRPRVLLGLLPYH
jgi:hypothetical protein